MIARDLEKKLTQMFTFMYEINGDYYVLGRDYFRPCTDLEMVSIRDLKKLWKVRVRNGLSSSTKELENMYLIVSLAAVLERKNKGICSGTQ